MRVSHNEMGTLLLILNASVASDIDINICVMSNNEAIKLFTNLAKPKKVIDLKNITRSN